MAYISPDEFQQGINAIDLAQGRGPRFPEAGRKSPLLEALMDSRQEALTRGTNIVPGNLVDVLERRKREEEAQLRRLEEAGGIRG